MRNIATLILSAAICIACMTYSLSSIPSAYADTTPTPDKVKPMRCIYSTVHHFGALRNPYACEISGRIIITRRNTELDVNGDHLAGRRNENVMAFKGDASVIHYFPKNLNKIFPNLLAILLNLVQLKEIRQTDLKPFPELQYIDLYENKIEYLEADLFKYNKKLEVIWLSNNQIKFIDDTAFEGLTKIRSLYLGFNICISRSVTDNNDRLMYFWDLIKIVCGNNSKNAMYNPKNAIAEDDYDDDDDDKPDEKAANQTEAETKAKALTIQVRSLEDEVNRLKGKREQALQWLVQFEDENKALKKEKNETLAEMTRLKETIRKSETASIDYVKQIFGLREDLRKQVDATNNVVLDIKNKMNSDQDNIKYQKEEILKLRGQILKLNEDNRKARDNYDNLMLEKESRDMTSTIVIMFLAFAVFCAVGFIVYKQRSNPGQGMNAKSYNDFENASMKLVNDGPSASN